MHAFADLEEKIGASSAFLQITHVYQFSKYIEFYKGIFLSSKNNKPEGLHLSVHVI